MVSVSGVSLHALHIMSHTRDTHRVEQGAEPDVIDERVEDTDHASAHGCADRLNPTPETRNPKP